MDPGKNPGIAVWEAGQLVDFHHVIAQEVAKGELTIEEAIEIYQNPFQV